MSEGEDPGLSLPTIVSETVAAVPERWREKLTKFLAHFVGSKMPAVAGQVADHADTLAARSLIRQELAKAAAAKAIQNPELVDRTLHRLCGDLFEQQENIESIAVLAAEEILHNDTPPNDDDVSSDWRRKFSNFAGDVSDPDMQRIWAKILAGEFLTPGSFSFRTLRIVSEMGSDVAETFSKISDLRFAGNVIWTEGEEWNSGRKLADLKALEDWGLIHEVAGQISRPMKKNNNRYVIWGDIYAGVIFSTEGPPSIDIPIVSYTASGIELIRLLPDNDEIAVISQICNTLKSKVPDSNLALIGQKSTRGITSSVAAPFTFLWGDQSVLDEALKS